MAIQGSTKAFPLHGLLEFLGTTGRTGRLVVQSRPQVALVAVRSGRLVAAGLSRGDELPDIVAPPDAAALGEILVDILTLPAGRFAFHPDGVTGTVVGFEVDEALAVAREMVRDHGDDSAVTARHAIVLVEEPSFDRVTMTDEQWDVVVAVGDGASVADVTANLGLGLPAVRRRVEGLVRLGLAVLADPPAPVDPPAPADPHGHMAPTAGPAAAA